MFSPATYKARRRALLEHEALVSGLVLFLGNELAPMNYEANPYPFRQDSTFLYYFGLDVPALYGLLDQDEGSATLYGRDPDLEDIVWTGDQPSMNDYAARAGVPTAAPVATLQDDLTAAIEQGRRVHFLPPYRSRHRSRLEGLLGIQSSALGAYASTPLIRAVVDQRSTKTEREVAQIEEALELTARLHQHVMRAATPGTMERELVGAITGLAAAEGRALSFPPTCTIHGEILHNHTYDHSLEEGDLLLLDAGATSSHGYAGDVTRVTPVSGQFTARQRALYEAVLHAQTTAIDAIAPGVPFKDVHLIAARQLTRHLVDLGLMQGDPEQAVEAGAHALFFPHGLGHMLGLDPHDMENLGEEYVGYAEDQSRSEQFGLDALRLARPLEEGFVVTVEPGCYFIPQLIDRWKEDRRHEAFIDYDVVEEYRDSGGIRIEDDVLVTADGARILGPPIPKRPEEVESIAGASPSP